MIFTRNTKSIKGIYDEFSRGTLCVDDGYQRKKVWSKQDNVRFVETILLEMVTPEVFFWTADVNPDTGESVVHIVDGQQRIGAIIDYIDGRLALETKSLLSEEAKCTAGGKSFNELSEDERSRFWMYEIPIVNIDRSCTREQIIDAFKRLNLTEYSLNAQERRHSDEDNAFGRAAEILAGNDFWEHCGVFSASDVRRMRDVTYCCGILILAARGIVDQADNTAINRFYSDNAEAFDEDGLLATKVDAAIQMLSGLSRDSVQSFLSKKTQLYTLFSLAFYLADEEVAVPPEFETKLVQFISAYNLFKNSVDYFGENEQTRRAFELVKKYKLASSEGVNKGSNRVIRFGVLKSICLVNSESYDMEDLIRYLTEQE